MLPLALTIGSLLPLLVLSLAATALIWLLRCYPALRGTTLVSPWWWTVGALAVTTGVVMLTAEGRLQPGWQSHALYLAGAVSFCPLMALLGAKRPQDSAWQFVVLTLLIVLLLPSGESLLYHPGAQLQLHSARGWFLWILIGLGLFNTIATRHWMASLLVAVAQVMLLAQQLPLFAERVAPQPLWALLLLLAATLVVVLDPWRPRDLHPWDRAWRDFRDSFGTLWSLRVAERFNAAAQQHGWNLRLRWRGFVQYTEGAQPAGANSPEPVELDTVMQTTLWGLWRRFVSPQWLQQRVDCRRVATNID